MSAWGITQWHRTPPWPNRRSPWAQSLGIRWTPHWQGGSYLVAKPPRTWPRGGCPELGRYWEFTPHRAVASLDFRWGAWTWLHWQGTHDPDAWVTSPATWRPREPEPGGIGTPAFARAPLAEETC